MTPGPSSSPLLPTVSDSAGLVPVWRVVFADELAAEPLYVDVDSLNSGAIIGTTRSSITVEPQRRVSLASYMNAFPAAYWRHSTAVRRVVFSGRVDAAASVTVFCSDVTGAAWVVAERQVDGVFALEASIDDAADGGWLWCELTSGTSNVTLSDATWSVPVADRVMMQTTTTDICMTTFNLPSECLANLGRLAADAGVRAALGRIVVVDQGTHRVSDEVGFTEVAEELGEQLCVIEQDNLGGSGGFSRGMTQALDDGADFALLLDDDVLVEPESILRAIAFAEFSTVPTIVGGHMLDLNHRTVLHSFGETVDVGRFWWHAVDERLSRLDFAQHPLASFPAAHRRIDVAFNGWWMCLIPAAVIREVGVALPVFIKWDDAEFGLRAASHGFPTVSLPGAAVWHVSWLNKDDGLDWQAYFQLRNRVIAALRQLPTAPGRGLFRHIQLANINHIVCVQYGAVELRNLALADVLRGPAALVAEQGTVLRRVRAALEQTGQTIRPLSEVDRADAVGVSAGVDGENPDDNREPGDSGVEEEVTPATVRAPADPLEMVGRVLQVFFRQLRGNPEDRPLPVIPRSVGKWWGIGAMDGAVMEAASGKGVFVLRRDRARAWRDFRQSRRLLKTLKREWKRLSQNYSQLP